MTYARSEINMHCPYLSDGAALIPAWMMSPGDSQQKYSTSYFSGVAFVIQSDKIS